MPAGVPVATFAIGEAGAINAALFAIELLAHDDDQLHKTLVEYRRKRHDDAVSSVLPPA
jgi:5-(carboxyamino)imidazole ribonucleotide mutase